MNIVLITLSLILTAKSIVKKHIEPYVLITLCFILTDYTVTVENNYPLRFNNTLFYINV